MEPLELVLLGTTLGITGFSGFSIRFQYRYATQLLDMLPIYPILTLIPIVLWFPISLLLPNISLFTFIVCTIAAIICLPLAYITFNWRNEYNLDRFREFLEDIQKESYAIISFEDYDNGRINSDKVNVILRHDVDISLKRAARMADIQKKSNIQATYFFRLHAEKYTFEEAIPMIQKLVKDGFHIGLHYETLSLAMGNKQEAVQMFEKDVTRLREIAPVHVVAAHGQKGYKNRDIWGEVNSEHLGVSSAYDVTSDMYLSDAGGKRLKDKNSIYLFNRIYEAAPGQIVQVLIHPDWWM